MENIFFLAKPDGYYCHLGLLNKYQHPEDQLNLHTVETYELTINVSLKIFGFGLLYCSAVCHARLIINF